MAVTVPQPGQDVSATTFGIPVANAINEVGYRFGATRTTIQTPLTANQYVTLSWSTTIADTGGVIVNATDMKVPTGRDGIWGCTVSIASSGSNPGSYVSIYLSGNRFDVNGTGSGAFGASLFALMAANDVCQIKVWTGTTQLAIVSSRVDFYRLAV